MTDAMLRLAMAVYGADAAWRDESELRVYVRRDFGAIEPFDPANNVDQVWDVLAWLLKTRCVSVHGMPHCVGRGTIDVEGAVDNDKVVIEYDGTASGIRRAVGAGGGVMNNAQRPALLAKCKE